MKYWGTGSGIKLMLASEGQLYSYLIDMRKNSVEIC